MSVTYPRRPSGAVDKTDPSRRCAREQSARRSFWSFYLPLLFAARLAV